MCKTGAHPNECFWEGEVVRTGLGGGVKALVVLRITCNSGCLGFPLFFYGWWTGMGSEGRQLLEDSFST